MEDDDNYNTWYNWKLGEGAMRQRMLMASWLCEAFHEFENSPIGKKVIRTAFEETGFLLAKDRSEDCRINLRNYTGTFDYHEYGREFENYASDDSESEDEYNV